MDSFVLESGSNRVVTGKLQIPSVYGRLTVEFGTYRPQGVLNAAIEWVGTKGSFKPTLKIDCDHLPYDRYQRRLVVPKKVIQRTIAPQYFSLNYMFARLGVGFMGPRGDYWKIVAVAENILNMNYYGREFFGPTRMVMGKVTHYWRRPQVAAVELIGPLSVGDTIFVGKGTSFFEQQVRSMRLSGQEHSVLRVEPPQRVTFPTSKIARPGSLVLK